MALIEQDLRELMPGPAAERRRRPDKIDFYLAVHDQAVAGKSFREIATTLDQPVSTVKTAFFVACGHIFGSQEGVPTKSQLLIRSIDPDAHGTQCRECRDASTVEAMCSLARAYVSQDAKRPVRRARAANLPG
jgi:hypothetical protein